MEPEPDALAAPAAEIVVDRCPGRELARKLMPLATRPQNIENRVQHFAQAQFAGTAPLGTRQVPVQTAPRPLTRVAVTLFFLSSNHSLLSNHVQ